MKVSTFSIIIFFLAILIFAIFLGGREINSKIEETIKNNYQTEMNPMYRMFPYLHKNSL